MKYFFFIPLICLSVSLMGQQTNKINITPVPAEMKVSSAKFLIDKNTGLILEGGGLENSVNFLNDYLQNNYGFKLKIRKKSAGKNEIILNYERMDYKYAGAYTMEVNNNGVYIAGDNEAGVFNGMQTLIQLLPSNKKSPLSIPQLSIKDYPRFAYRGMHLDVARHFFPVDLVKKYLDYLAYHKFNTFHWHLTEDQGWRIEIKKYPRLTSVGGYRNGTITGRFPGKGNDSIKYGGYYTQEQIKEIVKYAADRYITVIPEIDMPGHSSAAIAAYPQLSCFPEESSKYPKGTKWAGPSTGKQVQQAWGVFEDVYCPTEFTFNFLQDVLDEVLQLFPSKYIHVGGDEAPKAAWKRSEFAQQLIKQNNLKDEHGLQSYFIQRIEKYLNSKGRNLIGWDEILEGGLAPNATVMSWRGEKGGIAAAKQNHFVIMTPESPLYLNHAEIKGEDSITQGGYNPIENVYNYDPLSKQLNEQQGKYILGAQGNVWTEYIRSKEKLEYMIFPRMSALSEALWTPKAKKSWDNFESRLPAIIDRYKMWGANYNNAYFKIQSAILPTENYNGVLWKLQSKDKKGKIIYIKGRTHSSTQNYTSPVLITANTEFGAALAAKDHRLITKWQWQKFAFNKATGKKITLVNPPMGNWQGSGAFTLVNSVVTERKLEQSAEWIGFIGKDLDAVIDLGKEEKINVIRLNVLKQEGSWIYLPSSVEFFTSPDGINFTSAGKLTPDANGVWADERKIEKNSVNITARYIRVLAKSYGIIPPGVGGGGTQAWLFADEIEVE